MLPPPVLSQPSGRPQRHPELGRCNGPVKLRGSLDLLESELHRKPPGNRKPADLDLDSTAGALNRHLGMWKHESSALTQLRTGKVGVKAFLFQRQVPEMATPHCQCGSGEETPAHLALHCLK